jgi:alpha-N-acetylglucosaminidase
MAAVIGRLMGWSSLLALIAASAVVSPNPEHSGVNEYPGDPISGAQALLQRVLPTTLFDRFELQLIPKANATVDVMQLSSHDGKVVLRGSGGVELASALNWYLNDWLNITFDWNTYANGQWEGAGRYNISGDLILPLPSTSEIRPRRLPYSYYMNVCTPGYSLAFVPWSYWQKHIDWMALNGVNLPLAFTGQEYLWYMLFTNAYKISLQELQSFFAGPAFLPWFRMGNIRGWGGGLPLQWLTARRDLQLKILARQRGLGMKPVLGAFSGHVPSTFAMLFPDANVTKSPSWARFKQDGPWGGVSLLDPNDKYFREIGTKFIALQAATYGTDHIYNTDTYNEMNPPSADLQYLKGAAKSVFKGMTIADPLAVWLMQGWTFQEDFWASHNDRIEAYLSGVPTPSSLVPGTPGSSGLWVLDLFGASHPIWSKTNSYFGKPFLQCTLLNYGGMQGILGDLNAVVSGVEAAIENSTVIGVGITMEGIWTNYPIFEITMQMAWALPNSDTPSPTPATPAPPTNASSLFSGPSAPGNYLKGYPAGAVRTKFLTLDAAMRECVGPLADCCGGITLQTAGDYELRASSTYSYDGAYPTTSWKRLSPPSTLDRQCNASQHGMLEYYTRRYPQFTEPVNRRCY